MSTLATRHAVRVSDATEADRAVAALLAAGRLTVGAVAFLRPGFAVRTWLGRRSVRGPAGRVLGRALGVRDLALAVGAIVALVNPDADLELRRWVLLGAVADGADALATLLCWRSLPRLSRFGVLCVAGGAAVAGGLVATR